MDDSRKLVRGLKDISPLFGVDPVELPARRTPEVQILAVSTPDCDGDSLLLNTFFASQVAAPGRACSLLSILSRANRSFSGPVGCARESLGDIERYGLFWDEFRDLVSGPTAPRMSGMLQGRDIFLDFEYRHLFHFDRAVSLLDKWVLVLKPTAESLTEGYKMMKVGLAINPQLEFYIALSGKAEEVIGNIVFDRFSDFARRHLNVPLGWLGWMDLADPARHFSSDLHIDILKYNHWDPRPNLQKYVVAGWIDSLEERAPARTPVEVVA